jgi:hypothetical protein
MSDLKIMDEMFGGLSSLFVDNLNEKIDSGDRLAMAKALKDWLAGARVKPLPDLEDRRAWMCQKIDKMVESVTFSKVGDEIVVMVSGDGEDTLKKLQNGTEWFDPCENVVSVMISALWKS